MKDEPGLALKASHAARITGETLIATARDREDDLSRHCSDVLHGESRVEAH
jgi:hypothetical protein